MSFAGASDAIAHDYRTEVQQFVARRAPLATGAFLFVVSIGGMLDWYLQPHHATALVLMNVGAALGALAYILVVHWFPTWARPATVVAGNAAGLTINGYAALVQGNGEMSVLSLGILLGGLVVLYPLGLRDQALLSLGAVIGYPVALRAGVIPALPAAYGIFALLTAAVLAMWGAYLLDSYRFTAYRHAAEQAALARENARLMEEARAANRTKSEFVATVSHELRTPLTAIAGYADLLLEGAFQQPEERTNVLHRIRQQATQELDLIQGLLDVNRLEADSIALALETFRIADVMENLRGDLPASWCRDGVRLDWQVTDGQVEMYSDRRKVEMILRNLIHNALKYTARGSVTVRAERHPDDDRLRFSVADTGEGIAAKDLAHIFEMYRQGSSSPPRGGGVGLGLHIVKRLTEALGGEVTVASRPGVGTQFVVLLPAQSTAGAASS